MPEVTTSITIDRAPDDVWKVVRDVGSIDQWMPMIETCGFDGESRRMTLAGGLGALTEKILSLDDDTRTLTYTITEAPMSFDHYLATWTVEPVEPAEAGGEGTTVTWKMEIEPEDLASLMQGSAEGALAALKEHLES